MNTPILFLTFNRLEETKQVFNEIKKYGPSKLYLASDGPRKNKEGEREIVKKIREYILDNITWPCKVKTLFRHKNLGCKYAVSSAIDWFFKNERRGIILEDDCLPSQSFFRFCEEMLTKYKNDREIMQISGTNVEVKSKIGKDYFFSKCFNVWGWATWRRAWSSYDVEMKDWPKLKKENILKKWNYSLYERIKTRRLYDLTYSKEINTWDYQWGYACMKKNSLCIIPTKNLIKNIGFEKNATHTNNYDRHKSLEKFEITFPLIPNDLVLENKEYKKEYSKFFNKNIIKRKIKILLNMGQ